MNNNPDSILNEGSRILENRVPQQEDADSATTYTQGMVGIARVCLGSGRDGGDMTWSCTVS